MKRCQSCGHTGAADHTYCLMCGARLPDEVPERDLPPRDSTQPVRRDPKTCPFCAEKVKPEAVVCRHCGRDLPPPARRKFASRHPILTIVGVLMVVGWISSLFQTHPQAPKAPSAPAPTIPGSSGVPGTDREDELFTTIRQTPGVKSVRRDGFSLWVGVSLGALGQPPRERAKELADLIARKYLGHVGGQGICVHVYYGESISNELASSCATR